jgi:hypothetical protein
MDALLLRQIEKQGECLLCKRITDLNQRQFELYCSLAVASCMLWLDCFSNGRFWPAAAS